MSYAQVLTGVAVVLAGALRGTDRRIERHLRHAGATSPERAVTMPRHGWLMDVRVRRFVNAGAIRTLDERYFIDEEGWRHWRSVRRRRALTVIGVMLAVIAVAWWQRWIAF